MNEEKYDFNNYFNLVNRVFHIAKRDFVYGYYKNITKKSKTLGSFYR
jgi:hypothetical protein